MPNFVNLVRPDGSILQVEASEAGPLMAAGYREESLQAAEARAGEAANQAQYSGGWSQVKAGIEGLGSGLTLGLSDKMLEGMESTGLTDDSWRKRAEYNPGTRLATEIAGQVLPAVLTGGESLAADVAAPAKGLTTLAEGAAKRFGGGAASRGLIRGGVEGAGFGLGQQVSESALTGDSLTVEGTLAGMGWGALWGGGIGGSLGAVEGRIEARTMAKREAVTTALRKTEAEKAIYEEKWGSFHTAISDAGKAANDTVKAAGDQLGEAEGALKSTRATNLKSVVKMEEEAKAAMGEAKGIRDNYFNEMSVTEPGHTSNMDTYLKKEKLAGIRAFNDMKAALKSKDWGALEEASDRFQGQLKKINEGRDLHIGSLPGSKPIDLPTPFKAAEVIEDPVVAARHKMAVESFDQLKDLGVAGKFMSNVAQTPAEFTRMSPARFEKLSASMETFLSHPAAELAGAQEGIRRGIQTLSDHMGITTEGPVSSQLRGIWEALRNLKSDKTLEAATEAVKSGIPAWKKGAAAASGVALSRATQTGWMGYNVGRNLVSGLLTMKGAIVGRVSELASKWVPAAGKAAQVIGPKLEPLKTKLDGTLDIDRDHKKRSELMKARAEEIYSAAPQLRDTIYRAIGPLDIHHPEFALETYKTAISQFSFLLDKVPRDPGNAFDKLRSLWTPDPVATAKFARYYEAFHNPMGVIQGALKDLKITPEGAEGLREMWPALYGHLRLEMIGRLSDPKVMNALSYQEQVSLGLLLSLPLHSSMTPQFIASQQQMYTERNQGLKDVGIPPQAGADGGGGRPSGPANNPRASAGQRITAH